MSVIVEHPPEAIRIQFEEPGVGWHGFGLCQATTSIGPRGHGALSVSCDSVNSGPRMALELEGDTPALWRWTRVDDGAEFEGRMQTAGDPVFTFDGKFSFDLVALEAVRRIDVVEAVEEAPIDVSPEKLAALEAIAGQANEQVNAALRSLIEARDPEALDLGEAISAVVAGGQDAIVRLIAATIDDSDLTFAVLEDGFRNLLAELVPPIVSERLLAGPDSAP